MTDFLIKLCAYCFYVFVPFYLVYKFYYLYYRFAKGIKPVKRSFKKVRFDSLFKRLFILFPRQLAYDKLTRNPNEFPLCETGLRIVEGEQGSGKTTVMTYLLNRYQRLYPLVKVFSNYNYSQQDYNFTSWEKDLSFQCSDTGAIYGIDEIHISLYSSLESKNFPPELLQSICQNRKNHRAIYGTVQNFSRCAKAIREQTKLLYVPSTILGCLTVCRVFKPILDDGGNVTALKFRKIFFLVQTNELRTMFNTFDIVSKIGKTGFVRRDDNISSSIISSNDKIFDTKKVIKHKINIK